MQKKKSPAWSLWQTFMVNLEGQEQSCLSAATTNFASAHSPQK
jgi:hypothetical protein